MRDTVTRYLTGIQDEQVRRAVRVPLDNLADRYSSQPLTSAGLTINGAGATFAKIGAAPFLASVQGRLVQLAAGAALPAPAGLVIPAGQIASVSFFVDAAGTLTFAQGDPQASLSAVNWPQFPRGKALVGILLITAGGAPFIGGTTALDAAATIYISPLGPFDPTVLV